MRNLLLLCLLALLAHGAAAQSVVRGRVLDGRDQSPLPGANAILIHLPDSARTGTATGPDGSFVLSGVAAGRYVLLTTFVGYQAARQALAVPPGGPPVVLPDPVRLTTAGVALKGVVVTGQTPPVEQRGDTTSINARAFKVNPDATAGDLVGKMPGITTDAQGNTQAQGERVQQVLVDGKPFFGSDPDAVLKNLPAEAVDRVEIFDQQSEQSRFSGFNDGNTQKTLNIVTKPQFRNGQFGRTVAGAGPDGGGTDGNQAVRYRGSFNLNDFHGNRRLTVLAQANNVNEQNFGADDLLGVGGNSGNFQVGQGGGISTTQAAGLNYSDSWNKRRTELTGSYFFNHSSNVLSSTTNRQFVIGTLYQEAASASSRNLNHRATFRFEHKFDSATSVLFRPRLSVQQNSSGRLLAGTTAREGTVLSTIATRYASDNQGLNPGGDLLLRRRLGRRAGRTLSLNVSGAYTGRQGTSQLQTTSTRARLDQQSYLTQHGGNLATNLAYTEPLGPHGQVQANYQLSYAPNDSDKRTYDLRRTDQQYDSLNAGLSNVFSNYYLTQGGGLSYRYNNRKIQASAGATGQVAELRGDQDFPVDRPVRYTFGNLLPQATLTYRPDRQHNLRLLYRTSTNAPSLNQLQAVVNNSNPQQLTIGNPDLRQEYQHSLTTRYSAANVEKKGNFFALLTGAYTPSPIANRTLIATRDTLVTPFGTSQVVRIPAGGQLTQATNLRDDYTLRAQAGYGRPVLAGKLNVNATLGGGFGQSPGLVNRGLNYARTPSATAGLTLSSNISERLDFTASTNATQSYVFNTLNTSLDSRYYSQNSRLRLSWILGPGLSVKTDLAHQFYRGLSSGYNQSYVLWNASLGKKLFAGQRGEIQLYAFDLLRQNQAVQRNVRVAYVEDVRSTVLQRYFLLAFTYNIRSANMLLPPAEDGGGGERRGNRSGGGGAPGGGGYRGQRGG